MSATPAHNGMMDPSADIASSVSKLSLESSPKTKAQVSKAPSKKAEAVADSWEDEDVSSGSETNSDHENGDEKEEAGSAALVPTIKAGTQAPPPTPLSPTHPKSTGSLSFSPTSLPSPRASPGPDPVSYDQLDSDAAGSDSAPRRPEKTDAVARRMIASALGMKVPRLSEEQRAYEKAMREKERKRREEERQSQRRREEEALRAKQAVWDE